MRSIREIVSTAHGVDVGAQPSKPADATPQEWAAAVRLTFATARSLSALQGIPSHWLEAMRDAALGVEGGPIGAPVDLGGNDGR